MNVQDMAFQVRTCCSKHSGEFYAIFRVPLNQFMWNSSWPLELKLLGFDIIAFDEWLAIPEDLGDISMETFVTQKFGERAAQLIQELIKYPTPDEPTHSEEVVDA